MKHKRSLESFLLENGIVTREQLDAALKRQHGTGEYIGKILIEMGAVKENELLNQISDEFEIPQINLSQYFISGKTVKLIPENVCREYLIVPLYKTGNSVTVAAANPFDMSIMDKIHTETGCVVEIVMAREKDIISTIDQHFRISDTINKLLGDLGEDTELVEQKDAVSAVEEASEDAPVIKVVNLIIVQAIKNMVSDIHIEPDEYLLRIRYRIDGVLHESLQLPKHLQNVIASRIKILSGMNIAEKRIPQDGHIAFKLEGRDVDIRAATYPTVLGEKVVLRILYKTGVMYGLEDLGFLKNELVIFEKIITQPHGIILITGPTGSGKTTTLYAALEKVSSIEKNLITIEDPVERRLPYLNQSQVNTKAGWTFASALRNILRQDPDIIMVGEIRDIETARISIRSALTGHLVFSTLHTNDAPSSATRLVDMGVEPFLVSASLVGVIAQRLVRLNCPDCSEPYNPGNEMVEGIKEMGFKEKKIKFYKGKGCKSCNQTGYKGRTGIFELMIPDDEIRSLIVKKAPPNVIKDIARKAGTLSLRESGMLLVSEGKTTLEELLRVTQDEEIGG